MTTASADPHERAKRLARGLAAIPGIRINPDEVETNILVFGVGGTGLPSGEISAKLKERGVLANGVDPTTMRMVTHYDVDDDGITQALEAFREVVRAGPKRS